MVVVNDVLLAFVWRDSENLLVDTYNGAGCTSWRNGKKVTADIFGYITLSCDNDEDATEKEEVLREWAANDEPVSLMWDSSRNWVSITNQKTGARVITS